MTITNNRVVGVDGSAYAGNGVPCSASEACNDIDNGSNADVNNIGHSCMRGYYVLRVGRECTKVSGYNFYKMSTVALNFLIGQVDQLIIDDVIVADSKLGLGAVFSGPDSSLHRAKERSLTLKACFIYFCST